MSGSGLPFLKGNSSAQIPTPDFGQAGGDQALTNIIIQLMREMLLAMQGNVPGNNFFQVYPITAAGDLDITALYPNVRAGIFSLRKTVSAPTVVTLPAYGGPWGIADGDGTCAPANAITVQAAGGFTVKGIAADYMTGAWDFRTYVLDTDNYLRGL